VILDIVRKLICVLWIPAYRNAFLRTRVAASIEHDDVLEGLVVETVVDIGSNRGQFALCARRLFPKARIYAFEPLAKPARTFREVFRNDPLTQLFEKAIGADPGTGSMHVSRWDVSSSLLPFAQAQHDNFPLTEEANLEQVSIARLADCLDATQIAGDALLKIDVQGYESSVLEGCGALLGHFKYVYVECSFITLYVGQPLASEVVERMLLAGFRLECVANLSHGKSRRPIQADFLFVRQEERS
jgi:FkbM family methyltransferase